VIVDELLSLENPAKIAQTGCFVVDDIRVSSSGKSVNGIV